MPSESAKTKMNKKSVWHDGDSESDGDSDGEVQVHMSLHTLQATFWFSLLLTFLLSNSTGSTERLDPAE